MARRVIHPAADFDYWAHIGANAPQFEDDYDMMDEDEEEYERKPIVNHRFSPGSYRMPLVREVMLAASTASSTPSYTIRDRPPSSSSSSSPSLSSNQGENICAVCGDGQAKLHYGVLACYGCKGFFRRTLTGKYRYACRFDNACTVDKYQRNSCRYCRFQRCLQVGMDPKAVRPDRDPTGNQRTPRAKKHKLSDDLLNHVIRLQSDDWSKKLPMEVRILLMQLMQVESKVVKGDESIGDAPEPPMLPEKKKIKSLRDMFEQKPNPSERTEMSYEPFRMAKVEDLSEIAHRRAVAAVDWVDALSEMAEVVNTDDKVTLVKQCYSPLTIFNFSVRTAQNTQNKDILCLAGRYFVPKKLPPEFNEQNQLSNNLIDRCLHELVGPLRKLNLREEEIVPLKAIIILDPNAKGLSPVTAKQIEILREKAQDLLFHVAGQSQMGSPSARFGNLLMLLPTVASLSNIMSENMQFCQTFGSRASGDPLLREMFGDFKLEDPRFSSSVSPPILFENPADISLDTTSPLPEPGSVSHRSRFSSSSRRTTEASTQTDDKLAPPSHQRVNLLDAMSPAHTVSTACSSIRQLSFDENEQSDQFEMLDSGILNDHFNADFEFDHIADMFPTTETSLLNFEDQNFDAYLENLNENFL